MSNELAINYRVGTLQAVLGELAADDIVRLATDALFPGRIALTSSFGSDSAVLLHMVARWAPATPVLFLDTGKLFAETHAYRDQLIAQLGLRDVRSVRSRSSLLAAGDPAGQLWQSDTERCCALRKVVPLDQALVPFDAWITGRKRFQTTERTALAVFEVADAGRVRINPLAAWSESDIEDYLARHDLPRHPLVAKGYRSIGCEPCTSRTMPGEPTRAGRWRGEARKECGIHSLRRPRGKPVEPMPISPIAETEDTHV